MSHKNAVFSKQSHLRTTIRRMTGNASFKLSIFLSLAVVTQIWGWNKPIHAMNLDKPLVQKTSTFGRGFNSLRSGESAFLPRILDLLAFSVKSQAAEAEATPPPNKLEDAVKSKPIALVTEPSEQIYQVKRGDTINKIARQYQVSVNELVKLNRIQNANLISVDRKLKIPNRSSAIANRDRTKLQANSSKILQPLVPEAKPSDSLESQTKPAVSDPSSKEDSYITKLRAEIDELRAQHKQNKFKSTSSPISAVKSETQLESGQLTSSLDTLNTLSKSSLESNSSKVDTIALTLPPLADDEYLPDAFDGYTWPAQGVLTSGYGRRWGRLHKGIDIAAPIGTPIVAAAAGKVIGAGWHGGYGNVVKLEHLDGSMTLYAHVNRILVTHGQQIKQGELIAEMGSTGYSTGSHLHFEIHLRDRTVVNPLALLDAK